MCVSLVTWYLCVYVFLMDSFHCKICNFLLMSTVMTSVFLIALLVNLQSLDKWVNSQTQRRVIEMILFLFWMV